MREIKFRAWDKKKRRMVECDNFGYVIQIIRAKPIITNDFFNSYEDIMQYTGLKDKDGKEIYEGDIIRFTFEGEPDTLGHVEYIEFDGAFVITIPDLAFSDGDFSVGMKDEVSDIKIIGNVHEDKELLK